MKLSRAAWQTYKEVPKEAEIPSHKLLLKSGLIHKSGSGLYQYLPFAVRVLQKIENIIREELNKIGAQETIMSVVTNGELWKESGRWDLMEGLMLKFKDRGGKDLCLSPTNEEAITDIFKKLVSSYKQLPVNLYQINTKFRDEIRPRYGLMRGREFTMKDGYSFHLDKDCLDQVYNDYYQAYSNIFKRMGLDFIIVEADAGAMGTSESKTHEFQVVADSGEDDVIFCPQTGHASNREKAKANRAGLSFCEAKELTEISTPEKSTIKDVCSFLKVPQHHSLKSLVFTQIKDEKESQILVFTLGDDELNELKLKNYLACDKLHKTNDSTLESLGLCKGFIGPLNLRTDLQIIFDEEIDENASYVVGANKADYHLEGFVPKRDLKSFNKVDVRLVQENDQIDGHPIEMKKGIEVGHIFQLGTKYTQSMKASVLDKNGKQLNPLMGCYGIGVTRTMAAAIEQSHDENGIIWPMPIAPYQVYFAMIAKSDETKALADKIYADLLAEGIEVVFDDRGLGPGNMFKDAELLGVPLRLTLGERDFKKDGFLEIKNRKTSDAVKIKPEEVVSSLKTLITDLMNYS